MRRAIERGKHVYCEKPLSVSTEEALDLARLADQAGVKHGVVQDKLFLPGIRKLKRLVDAGFFGRILSVRGEFGYWVFEGDWRPARAASVVELPHRGRRRDHRRHVLPLALRARSHLRRGDGRAVHRARRTFRSAWTSSGRRYRATADDAAYGTFKLAGGEGEIIAQFNSSWAVRVYRDELLSIQVDGTEGSAVAGLRGCKTQHRVNTPRPTWNPDIENPFDFFADWQDVPDNGEFDNAFKYQWEMFLRHVAIGTPYIYDFYEGAKGVQLAELGLKSWAEQRWLDVPALPRVGALQPRSR